MHKKIEINQTKIKGGCQSGRKLVPRDSKSDFALVLGFGLPCQTLPTELRNAMLAWQGPVLLAPSKRRSNDASAR